MLTKIADQIYLNVEKKYEQMDFPFIITVGEKNDARLQISASWTWNIFYNSYAVFSLAMYRSPYSHRHHPNSYDVVFPRKWPTSPSSGWKKAK